MYETNRSIIVVSLAALCMLGNTCGDSDAAQNTRCQLQAGAAISTAEAEGAQTHDRMLTPAQLSEKIRAILHVPPGQFAPEAFGSANHPFTTKRASAKDSSTPVAEFPWRATGKLFMKFGAQTFVCTASVIGKGLLVTAAHCVHNFGQEASGCADTVTFEPARHEGSRPFGTWTATQVWVPTTYFDGTDVCSSAAPGVVCENDLAVVVLAKKDGKQIAEVTGQYGYPKGDDDYGYASFLGQRAAQITQLGYPAKNYAGDKMVRTDSLGYWDEPNNVIIGSNQTGGSSGAPWLQNFGSDTPDFTGTPPIDNDSNQVVGTTSWGFTADTVKVQGASRFSTNTAYTTKSNIESLVSSACAANPDAC
jgi:V8-like Glu-specific endopeptidase